MIHMLSLCKDVAHCALHCKPVVAPPNPDHAPQQTRDSLYCASCNILALVCKVERHQIKRDVCER